MSEAPGNTATDLVSFKVLLNNTALSNECRILSIEVSKSFNRISSAKLVIVDGDPALQDFAISSKEDSLLPGSEIELQLGYQGKSQTIFKGIVVKQSIKSGKNKKSVLAIEARDKFFQLTLNRHSGSFNDKSDTEIIGDIVKQAGFGGNDVDIADTKIKYAEMVQYNTTDWDFIVSRAEMNSMLAYTNNNKLVIKTPDTGQQPAFTLTYGVDIIEMESEMDGRTQIKEVKSYAWDFKEQKVVETDASASPFAENGNVKGESLADALHIQQNSLYHGGALHTDELKAWGDAAVLKSRMAKITGSVKIKGRAEITPGQVITIKGFGKRFNGNIYITGVAHHFNTSIWETSLSFGLPQSWFYQKDDIVERPAAGMVPGVTGLQIGVVVQIDDDPDNEDRVKIKLPVMDANEGIWARVASLDAGKNRGAFFRPELQDEVVVGFLNDDPRHAIILGMLNSSAHPAPLQARQSNDQKGFITRSNIKLVFDDDKKSINIETPAGKKIAVDDDADSITFSDQHNNKIVLDAGGISIESGKDISFKTSTGDFKIQANNIENDASLRFTAKGNSGAELQSGGQTVVKGAIVNIN
jgi:Rhs element Vgr protein